MEKEITLAEACSIVHGHVRQVEAVLKLRDVLAKALATEREQGKLEANVEKLHSVVQELQGQHAELLDRIEAGTKRAEHIEAEAEASLGAYVTGQRAMITAKLEAERDQLEVDIETIGAAAIQARESAKHEQAQAQAKLDELNAKIADATTRLEGLRHSAADIRAAVAGIEA